MSTYVQRLIGAAKLDAQIYEEVEADQTAMGQALGTVVLASVASGIGSYSTLGMRGLLFGTVAALLGWFVWAVLTFFVGTKMLPEPQTQSNMGELLRTIGFSASPGLLQVLGFVPGIGPLIGFLASIWMLVAMVVAVRQALDYTSTGRAVGVCLIGFVVYVVVVVAVSVVFGIGAAALGSV